MTDHLYVTIHDHPREETTWRDQITLDTLAALIDKMGEGERLYFTGLGAQWRVVSLKPNIARLGSVENPGRSIDLHGQPGASRGRLVAHHLASAHAAQLAVAMGKPPGTVIIGPTKSEPADLRDMRHYDDPVHAYLSGEFGRERLIKTLGAPPPPHEHVERSMADRLSAGPELSRDFDDRICGRCGNRRCDHPPSDDCSNRNTKFTYNPAKFTDDSVNGTWPVWISSSEAPRLLPALATATDQGGLERQLRDVEGVPAGSMCVWMKLEHVRYFLHMMRGSNVQVLPEAPGLTEKLAYAKKQLDTSLLRTIHTLPEGYDLLCHDAPGTDYELRTRCYQPVHAESGWHGAMDGSWVAAAQEARKRARFKGAVEETYAQASATNNFVVIDSVPRIPTAPGDVQFIEASWVNVKNLVTPHPVGRVHCNECKGTGKLPPLFMLPRECDACDGTGWMGGKIEEGSSENAAEAMVQRDRAPRNGKGEN